MLRVIRSIASATRELLPSTADFTAMRRSPRRDVLAGVTVACVALPLALAFGVASGLGAGAGIATAIVAGFVAAVFGGSNLQVSGPTGAMTVVLLPIVALFGAPGVLVVGLIAGVLLIALAFTGAGRYMQFLPLPVIEGFTLGIAIIIGMQQVPAMLGVQAEGEKVVGVAWSATAQWLQAPDAVPVLVTLVVAAAMLAAARYRPGLPVSLIAVAVSAGVVAWAGIDVATIGAIPTGLPGPSLPVIPWAHLSELIVPALAVAALAAVESLLCATVADAMTVDEHHDPNRELFGQGMANLAAPIFGGVPATAAIARTAVNVRSGARSRLSAITQSASLLIVVLVAARWVSYIPLSALAGVLLATVIQMVKISNIRSLLRSTRGDAVVLVVTAIATVALDLVTAVIIGLIIAGVYALRQVARSAHAEAVPLEIGEHSDDERALLNAHVVAYRLDGPLFFGAAHRFLLEVAEVREVRVVILRLSRVQTLDATGAAVLGDTIKDLEHRGVTVLLSGIRDEHHSIFTALGVYAHLAHERHIFANTPEAIAHAFAHLSAGHHTTETAS